MDGKRFQSQSQMFYQQHQHINIKIPTKYTAKEYIY